MRQSQEAFSESDYLTSRWAANWLEPEDFFQVMERPPLDYGHRYLDIRRDYAFKRIFGREECKELAIDLLESLFEGRKPIKEIEFGSTERQGEHQETRTTRFDVQCTAEDGEQFLIEMQFEPQDNLFGRIEFYLFRMGSDQIPSGVKGDNFPIPEIFAIAIVNFDPWKNELQPCGKQQNEYINSYDFRNIKTFEPYPRKVELMLVELPKFKKKLEELTTRLDKWLFLFKNLHHLTEPIFTDDPVFQKLFQVTEFNKLPKEDQKMIVIDRERDIRNIKSRWLRDYKEEVKDKFLAEGERKKVISFVQALIRDTDFDNQKIAGLAGVEEAFVENFR